MVFYEVFLKFREGAFGDEGEHLCTQGVLADPQNQISMLRPFATRGRLTELAEVLTETGLYSDSMNMNDIN